MNRRPTAFRVVALAVAVTLAVQAAGPSAAGAGTPRDPLAATAPAPRAAVAAPENGGGVTLGAPGDSFETPGTTSRVSVGLKNEQLAGASRNGSISADGRYVVFRAPFQTGGYEVGRIMLRDRVAKKTSIVAEGTVVFGELSNGPTAVDDPTISADGRFVAYTRGSVYTTVTRIFIWNRLSGASAPVTPAVTSGFADQPALSADGHLLAFRTDQNLSRADTNKVADVYVLDRRRQRWEVISAPSQTCLPAESGSPSISADGRYVAFVATCTGGAAGAVHISTGQILVRDRTRSTTALVSTNLKGTMSSGSSFAPSISADGLHVAFESTAVDLVAGDLNNSDDVFVWSRGATTMRASVSSGGDEAEGASGQASISADGRLVAFSSDAANLVPNDNSPNAKDPPRDIFVHDGLTGRTSRVSVGLSGKDADGTSTQPMLAPSGTAVVFTSAGSNLVGGDDNNATDVFVRDRPAVVALSPNPLDFGTVLPGSPTTQTATLSNTGAGPAHIKTVTIGGANAAAFKVTTDGCSGLLVYPAESCAIDVQMVNPGSGSLAAQLVVTDSAPGAPPSIPIVALVSNAKLVLSPPVGPPGIVVAVRGAGFIPGQPVTLAWSPAMVQGNVVQVVAGVDGSFAAQVLVMPNDALGPRKLLATSATATAKIATDADFLVVARSAQPPSSWYVRQLTNIRGPLVDRR